MKNLCNDMAQRIDLSKTIFKSLKIGNSGTNMLCEIVNNGRTHKITWYIF